MKRYSVHSLSYQAVFRARVLAVAALGLALPSAHAAEIVWAGSASGNWNVPANWNPAQVPSTNDTAIVTNAGTYTVTLNMNPVVDRLVLGGASGTQTLAIAGRALTINGGALVASNGVVHFNGGMLAGTGPIELHGVLGWINGELASNAVVNVAAGGRCDIASGPQYTKVLRGTLANAGLVTWRPLGSLVLEGTLHNLPGGVFDMQISSGSIINTSGTGALVNEGEVRKTVGTGNIHCYAHVVNTGTVDIQSGTLTLHSGAFFNDGCAFTGAGATQLAGGTNTLNGHLHSGNLHLLYDATLAGKGRLSGTLEWEGGSIGSGAALTIATNGHLLVSSTFQYAKHLYGDLVNHGTVTWKPLGSLAVGGTFLNKSGAVFDVQADNTSLASLAGGALILNEGLLQKTNGTIGNIFNVETVNNGRVEVRTGRLTFQGGFENPSGTIALAGGGFQSASPLRLSGGGLEGWGTVYNTVTNFAVVRPSRTNGVLAISGDYVQRLAGATVFGVGGSRPGVDQARLNVAGAAHLGGSVNVEWADGYLPEPGTNFPVMAYAAREGAFDFQNGFFLPGHGRRLEPSYGLALLELAAVAAPEPAGVPLGIASEEGSVMVAWPLEYAGWELHAKTNLLLQSGWTAVPTAGNFHLEAPPLPPSRFFRLVQP